MAFDEAMAKSNELLSEALLALATGTEEEKRLAMSAHINFNPYMFMISPNGQSTSGSEK